MKKITFILSSLLVSGTLISQNLCAPDFVNGCSNWNNQFIAVGSINWTFDQVDCAAFDYTNISTTLDKGVPNAMTVVNGDWCGCSVWIDLNDDLAFDNSENFYYAGNGSTASNTFNFDITIPANANDGTFLMRVIASWGSDGFNPGTNGSGACGSYQYGNYQDFNVVLSSANTSLSENLSKNSLEIYPNPSEDKFIVSTNTEMIGKNYNLLSSDGKLLLSDKIISEKFEIQTNELEKGVYFMQLEGQKNSSKIVKK